MGHPIELTVCCLFKLSYSEDSTSLVTISGDCVMSEWTEWYLGCCLGSRSPFDLTKTRTRSVITPPSNGGRECGNTEQHKSEKIKQCPADRSCISDCTDKLDGCKQMEEWNGCVFENGWPLLGMMKHCGKTCCGNPAKNPDKKITYFIRQQCQRCGPSSCKCGVKKSSQFHIHSKSSQPWILGGKEVHPVSFQCS